MNLWPYMVARSDDAYKGGSGTNDQSYMHYLETSESMQNVITTSAVNNLWVNLYHGIGRCNSALRALENVSESEFALKKERSAEMKFLRAQYYLRLKVVYYAVPWVDETMSQDDVLATSNVALSSDEFPGFHVQTLVQYTGTTKRTKYHLHVGKETADIRNFTY